MPNLPHEELITLFDDLEPETIVKSYGHECAPYVGIVSAPEDRCVYCDRWLTPDEVKQYIKTKVSL